MSVVIPFAHLGHVLIDLPVFLGPVVAVFAWVAITSRREKRRGDRARGSAVTNRGREASR